jgi:hypothetical protein
MHGVPGFTRPQAVHNLEGFATSTESIYDEVSHVS